MVMEAASFAEHRAYMGLKTMDFEGHQPLTWWDFPHHSRQPGGRGWGRGVPPGIRKDILCCGWHVADPNILFRVTG